MVNPNPDETVGEIIRFILTKRHPKTGVWDVVTKDKRILLGQVRWYGRWKKYAFMPESGLIVLEQTGLKEIMIFLEIRTRNHVREHHG